MNIHLQLQQLLSLVFILCLGMYAEKLYLPFSDMLMVLLFTLFVAHLFIYIKEKKLDYVSFSSLSTAIGVMLMLVTPHLWLYMFVIALGLFQKEFFTVEGRHFFNPSNFALIAALVFFYDDAHIVLGQLGDSVWLKLLLGVVAMSILVRVERWIIPLGFTFFYLLYEYIFVIHYDPVLIMEDVYHRFYSVSLALFVLFMLTDPKTTPHSPWQQLAFACSVALGASLLDRLYGFRVQHLFMILFVLSTLVPLLSLWQESKNKKKLFIVTFSLLFLSLSVIIFIQSQAPYYYEMDS